jgi:4-alpha-glucanotransferase
MSDVLRRENPAEERINIPSDPKHNWQYRMHINIEELISNEEFTSEFSGYIQSSGR